LGFVEEPSREGGRRTSVRGRVLIIDDEAEIRRNLSVGLMQEDYDVVACPDGISAIHELNAARQKGSGFDYLVTDIFMPDIDGLKILRVIKSLFPDLPVLVITGFGDDGLKFTALSEYNTAYLDKPFEIADLVKAMEELSPGTTLRDGSAGAAGPGEREMRESLSAYLTIRIARPERSMEIFDALRRMEGVQTCDAVYGDVDIILLAQASSPEGIREFFDKVRAVEGIEVASMSPVERPKIDRDVTEFIEIYRREVKRKAQEGAAKGAGTMSYIIVDIDPKAIGRVFTTVFFVDEVIFCDVVGGGSRLVGMITGLDAGDGVRKVIDKVSRIDGVLRVREAKVIKMVED
jgi:two-component system cell cycle response regulator CpdR